MDGSSQLFLPFKIGLGLAVAGQELPKVQIVIGGDFTRVDEIPRKSIARLKDEGSLDAGFYPGLGADDQVSVVANQGDKVILGGFFTHVNGAARNYIARLNTNGGVDTAFDPVRAPTMPFISLQSRMTGRSSLEVSSRASMARRATGSPGWKGTQWSRV